MMDRVSFGTPRRQLEGEGDGRVTTASALFRGRWYCFVMPAAGHTFLRYDMLPHRQFKLNLKKQIDEK